METEEKYEQALARARELYNAAKADIKKYETIFPELKEKSPANDEKKESSVEGWLFNREYIIGEKLEEFLDILSKLGEHTNFDRWSKADCAEWLCWVERQVRRYKPKEKDC